jgi:hypothetical protein
MKTDDAAVLALISNFNTVVKSALKRLNAPEDTVAALDDGDLEHVDYWINFKAPKVAELEAKLNSPELHDFAQGAVLEAAHQRERWGSEHDAGKEPQDWFWVVGYLAGKALAAHIGGNTEKALHHTISTAAVLNNWHAAISGASTVMRPGISEEKQAEADDEKSLQESESQA